MSDFFNMSLSENVYDDCCTGCGSLIANMVWGGMALCDTCYEEFSTEDPKEHKTDERLLGIVLECEAVMKFVQNEIIATNVKMKIEDMLEILEEAKALLSDTGTGEAKEIVDVSEKED
jgi:hypothetical protein